MLFRDLKEYITIQIAVRLSADNLPPMKHFTKEQKKYRKCIMKPNPETGFKDEVPTQNHLHVVKKVIEY